MNTDISRLMDGTIFRTKIRSYCEECGFRIDTISDAAASVDIMFSQGTQLCFIDARRLENRPLLVKFTVPALMSVGHLNELDPVLSTALLRRNSANWIGAWCIEEYKEDEVTLSCVYDTELETLSVHRFYDIVLLLAGECASFTELYKKQHRLT